MSKSQLKGQLTRAENSLLKLKEKGELSEKEQEKLTEYESKISSLKKQIEEAPEVQTNPGQSIPKRGRY